jgi:hypothetical protein
MFTPQHVYGSGMGPPASKAVLARLNGGKGVGERVGSGEEVGVAVTSTLAGVLVGAGGVGVGLVSGVGA